jgi:hypothetical protein
MDWDDLPPPLRFFLQGLAAVIERLAFLRPDSERTAA